MNAKLAKVDERFSKVEVGLSSVKDEIKGSKVDLSDTSSRREFEKLKIRVEKYHPLACPAFYAGPFLSEGASRVSHGARGTFNPV